jgi:hypothetical protein
MHIGLVVLGVMVVVFAFLMGLAATKPKTFTLSRTTLIAASPVDIFPLIDDFHEWPRWSPWEKLDPNLQRTYGGTARGKGAIYSWQGNRTVGQGRMEIAESCVNSRVVVDLHFIAPFEARNVTEFRLTDIGAGQSELSWSMSGSQAFAMRVMSLFLSLDKTIGKDFESGLATLKKVVEVGTVTT